MKKILLNTGGQPIRLNDIQAIQLNVQYMVSALARSFGAGPFRLNGAEITVSDSGGASPRLNITSGAIYYNYDIFLVSAVNDQPLASGTTLNDILTSRYWDVHRVDSDTRTFLNGNSHNILRDDTAVLVETPGLWGTSVPANIDLSFDYSDYAEALTGTALNKIITPEKLKFVFDNKYSSNLEALNGTITDKIITPSNLKYVAQNLLTYIEPWNDVTFETDWANFNPAVFQHTQYKKDMIGNVYVKGAFYKTVSGSGIAHPFTLPIGYRPVRAAYLIVIIEEVSYRVNINSTGEFMIDTYSNHQLPVPLNISFRID